MLNFTGDKYRKRPFQVENIGENFVENGLDMDSNNIDVLQACYW